MRKKKPLGADAAEVDEGSLRLVPARQLPHVPRGPWVVELGRMAPNAPVFGFAIRGDGKRPAICRAGTYEPHVLMLDWPKDAPEHPEAANYFVTEEVIANANMIGAAPSLYWSLVGLLAIPGVREAAEQSVFGSIVYAADAAIAKAEGQSFGSGDQASQEPAVPTRRSEAP